VADAMVWLSILLRWVLLAAAVALSAWVMPDVSLEGGVLAALWVALLIALANVLVQVLLRRVPRPSSFLLLAALTLAVNGLMIWLVSAVTDNLTVDGFLAAVGAAILISIFSMVLSEATARLLPDRDTSAEAPRDRA
jgi:putative membrane protein